MLVGVRGTLVSEYFAEELLADRFAGRLGESGREAARTAVDRVRRSAAPLGPASPVRAVFDVAVAPLVQALGFRVTRLVPVPRGRAGHADQPGDLAASLEAGHTRIGGLIVAWGDDLDRAWRDSIRVGIDFDVRWCLLFNGRQLRLVDSWRSYGRDHLEFDLEGLCDEAASFGLFWAVMQAGTFETRDDGRSLLDDILASSAQHGVAVCRSLRIGVLTALGLLIQGFADAGTLGRLPPPRPPRSRPVTPGIGDAASPVQPRDANLAVSLDALFEQSLTIVYRMLFLLFAEARRLVPTWHSIYRDAYSIETLRNEAEKAGPGDVAGLWETLQAISRLAHRGCRAGSLVVAPFNGRLFSPARTPLAESGRLDDTVARQVVVCLSTEDASAGHHRRRIAYRDLGVEQLGAVYESVLDYEPRIDIEPRDYSGENRGVRVDPDHKRGGRREGAGGSAFRPPPCASRVPPSCGRAQAPRLVVRLEGGSGLRKATGTFYTPQSLTSYLVRRTLHPLVQHARADQILALRILDPAMGSGAFLVAACRHLAQRYERALIEEGRMHPADVSERDRALFRRQVGQRCLFGVDRNPMAVQLARLSLWLATLAADCPLTFLDHHLACGDSLVGASAADVLRCPGVQRPLGKETGSAQRALFDADELRTDFEQVLPDRLRVGNTPGETVEAVQDKERTIQRLAGPDGPARRWKDVADLWCACWFWDRPDVPTRGVYRDLADALLGHESRLPAAAARGLCDHAREVAASYQFFHWQIEFPEVFFDASGAPLPDPGFDAVIGNPPWDMLRADDGAAGNVRTSEGPKGRTSDKAYDRALARFARGSGFYTAQSDGHPNRFQLFVERAFRLARRGGRIGLVVPWGLFSDHGCAGLRRLLFGRADTDTIVGFDNAKAIFPIHRSMRFAMVTMTTGGPTARTRCRFGEQDVAFLDSLPAEHHDEAPRTLYPLLLSPALLTRLSGDDLSVPDIRSPLDLEILVHAASSFPALSAKEGWDAHFGRELNATDDRVHFVERVRNAPRDARGRPNGRLLPVLEGKHVQPFIASLADTRFLIPPDVAGRLLARAPGFRRSRLAYRDVASATNRVTLVAAMLPSGCVTTHTLFCLKTVLDEDAQWLLCGVMNSYVANYLVRLRVTTHVSAGIIERLPVPVVDVESAPASEVITISRQLAARLHGVHDDRLQALVAQVYCLTAQQFAHVLGTFPLVEQERRDAAFAEFERLALKGRCGG